MSAAGLGFVAIGLLSLVPIETLVQLLDRELQRPGVALLVALALSLWWVLKNKEPEAETL